MLNFKQIEPKTGQLQAHLNDRIIDNSYLEVLLQERIASDHPPQLYTCKLYDGVNEQDLLRLKANGIHLILSSGQTAYFADEQTTQLVQQKVYRSFSDATAYGSLLVSEGSSSLYLQDNRRVLVIDDEVTPDAPDEQKWGSAPISNANGKPVDRKLLEQAYTLLGDSYTLLSPQLVQELAIGKVIKEGKSQVALNKLVSVTQLAYDGQGGEVTSTLKAQLHQQLQQQMVESGQAISADFSQFELKNQRNGSSVIDWQIDLSDRSGNSRPITGKLYIPPDRYHSAGAIAIGGTQAQKAITNQLFNQVLQATRTPFQYRAGVAEWDGMVKGECRSAQLTERLGVDAIIPKSAIKGDGKTVSLGIHQTNGLFWNRKAEAITLQQQLGSQVLVNFPKGTQADIELKVQQELERLKAIAQDPRAIARYFLESEDRRRQFLQAGVESGEGELEDDDSVDTNWLYQILQADVNGQEVVQALGPQLKERMAPPLIAMIEGWLPLSTSEFLERYQTQVEQNYLYLSQLDGNLPVAGESRTVEQVLNESYGNPPILSEALEDENSFTLSESGREWLSQYLHTAQGSHAQLLEHPRIVAQLDTFMQNKWRRAALGQCVSVPSAVAQPYRTLEKGEIACRDLPHGAKVAIYRSPVANSASVAVMTNNLKGLRQEREAFGQVGVVYLNPEDAKERVVDFDGDRVALIPELAITSAKVKPIEGLSDQEICIPTLPNGYEVTLFHSNDQTLTLINNRQVEYPESVSKKQVYLNPQLVEQMDADAPVCYGFYDGLNGFKTFLEEVDELNRPENRPIAVQKEPKIVRDANHPSVAALPPEKQAIALKFTSIEAAALDAANNLTGLVADTGMKLEAIRQDLLRTVEASPAQFVEQFEQEWQQRVSEIQAQIPDYVPPDEQQKQVSRDWYVQQQLFNLKLKYLESVQKRLGQVSTLQVELVENVRLKNADEITALKPFIKSSPEWPKEQFIEAVNYQLQSRFNSKAPVAAAEVVEALNEYLKQIQFPSADGRGTLQVSPQAFESWFEADKTFKSLIQPPSADGFDFQAAINEIGQVNLRTKSNVLMVELQSVQGDQLEGYLRQIGTHLDKCLKQGWIVPPPDQNGYSFQSEIQSLSRLHTLMNASNPQVRIQQVEAIKGRVMNLLHQTGQLDESAHEFRKSLTNYRKWEDLKEIAIPYTPEWAAQVDQALLQTERLLFQTSGINSLQLQRAVDAFKSAQPVDLEALEFCSQIGQIVEVGWVKDKKREDVYQSVNQEADYYKSGQVNPNPKMQNGTKDPIGRLVELTNQSYEGQALDVLAFRANLRIYNQLLKHPYTQDQQALVQEVATQYSQKMSQLQIAKQEAKSNVGPRLALTTSSGKAIEVTNLTRFDPSGKSLVWDAIRNQQPLAIEIRANKLDPSSPKDSKQHQTLKTHDYAVYAELGGVFTAIGTLSPASEREMKRFFYRSISPQHKAEVENAEKYNSHQDLKRIERSVDLTDHLVETRINGFGEEYVMPKTLQTHSSVLYSDLSLIDKNQAAQLESQQVQQFKSSLAVEDHPAYASALMNCPNGQMLTFRLFPELVADALQRPQFESMKVTGLQYNGELLKGVPWESANKKRAIRVAIETDRESKNYNKPVLQVATSTPVSGSQQEQVNWQTVGVIPHTGSLEHYCYPVGTQAAATFEVQSLTASSKALENISINCSNSQNIPHGAVGVILRRDESGGSVHSADGNLIGRLSEKSVAAIQKQEQVYRCPLFNTGRVWQIECQPSVAIVKIDLQSVEVPQVWFRRNAESWKKAEHAPLSPKLQDYCLSHAQIEQLRGVDQSPKQHSSLDCANSTDRTFSSTNSISTNITPLPSQANLSSTFSSSISLPSPTPSTPILPIINPPLPNTEADAPAPSNPQSDREAATPGASSSTTPSTPIPIPVPITTNNLELMEQMQTNPLQEPDVLASVPVIALESTVADSPKQTYQQIYGYLKQQVEGSLREIGIQASPEQLEQAIAIKLVRNGYRTDDRWKILSASDLAQEAHRKGGLPEAVSYIQKIDQVAQQKVNPIQISR